MAAGEIRRWVWRSGARGGPRDETKTPATVSRVIGRKVVNGFRKPLLGGETSQRRLVDFEMRPEAESWVRRAGVVTTAWALQPERSELQHWL